MNECALRCWGAVLILFASLPCRAEGFAFEVAVPKFKVAIPGIPQMKMEVHPGNATQPHLRFLGTDDRYTVAVFTPVAAAGMTPLECASAITKSLAARPGTPPSAQILKARLDGNTLVAFYATPLVAGVLLHAHILSAAGGTHCVEVHATRISLEEDDLSAWATDIEKASITAD